MTWARRRCLWGAAWRDEAPRKPVVITDSLSRRQPEFAGRIITRFVPAELGPRAAALKCGGAVAGGAPGAGVFGGVLTGSGKNGLAKPLE